MYKMSSVDGDKSEKGRMLNPIFKIVIFYGTNKFKMSRMM